MVFRKYVEAAYSQCTPAKELRNLQLAYDIARQSPDPNTQVGVVITECEGVCYGCNYPVLRLCDWGDLTNRDHKTAIMEHAERDAIYNAARHGLRVSGGHLIATWHSCVDCARAMISSGIKIATCHWDLFGYTPERWQDSILIAHGLLKDAGVELRWVAGAVPGAHPIRFDRKMWNPETLVLE